MSNDNHEHGITDAEIGGRLKRAAWGMFLLGPLGALIGAAIGNRSPKPPRPKIQQTWGNLSATTPKRLSWREYQRLKSLLPENDTAAMDALVKRLQQKE
jgi:hypothetical protein